MHYEDGHKDYYQATARQERAQVAPWHDALTASCGRLLQRWQSMETHSPLFLDVQQRLGHGRSHLPRKLSEEETAEVAYAFDKLAAGEQTVGARHVKIALRAMGFPGACVAAATRLTL